VGVAHIRLKTNNLAASREFYTHVLGFQEPLAFQEFSGGPSLTVFKVNDHQYIELVSEPQNSTGDRLVDIAFETTDAVALRGYLASQGVAVPDRLGPESNGDLSFTVKDPDGHSVEFFQYAPGGLEARNFGNFRFDTSVSQRIIHVGVTVHDRAAADRFYKDVLGFRLMWQGGMTDSRTDWVDMRVPEGTDWLEYMLNVDHPSPHTLGVMHHLALGVASMQQAYATVSERGYHGEKPQIGRDGKWQLNLYDPVYDPDGTRVELMEAKPVRAPCCSPMIAP
jgi:lactoylglutathione lyase